MSVSLISAPQVTVAAAGTEQRLVATNIDHVIAVYVSAPAANTGSVSVGDANVSITQGAQVGKGTTLTINAPEGQFIDIFNIWVDAASGDKVSISFLVKNN